MQKHSCIKCGTAYEDGEEDNYLCPPCLEIKKQVAAEIDKKYAGRKVEKPMTDLEIYEASAKTVTSPDGKITRSFAMTKL